MDSVYILVLYGIHEDNTNVKVCPLTSNRGRMFEAIWMCILSLYNFCHRMGACPVKE